MFAPGDLVEFFSDEDGGTWKPGVVVEFLMFHTSTSGLEASKWGEHGHVRIRVGEKVCVIRAIARCRMAMRDTTLPIEIVPGTNPPVFRWRQSVGTPFGTQVVDHEGPLPPNIEVAVQRLLGIAKQLVMDNIGLHGRNEALCQQVDALRKRCEGTVEVVAGQQKRAEATAQQQVFVKGGKGKG